MAKKSTGERLETFIHNETTVEHLHRYAVACDLAKNKVVADIACGEGYGSYLLSKIAVSVTGIDIDPNTIETATEKYKKANLNFLKGDVNAIPLKDQSIDLLVSFETLEHVSDHELLLKEFKRILKPEGVLVLSTPDRKYYSDIPKFNNPNHVRELYAQDFYNLMSANFKSIMFLKQNAFFSSIIVNEQNSDQIQFYEGSFEQLASTSLIPLYQICIASQAQIPSVPTSIFSGKKTWDKALKERMNKSFSYRLGNLLLWPLKKMFG